MSALIIAALSAVLGQNGAAPGPAPAPAKEEAAPAPWKHRVSPADSIAATRERVSEEELAGAVEAGVAHLLAGQEGDAKAEWPYEGVYRVRGQIPYGYRVGGTAIGAIALLEAPDYTTDEARKAAVERAFEFVCAGIAHPDMSHETYDAGYDVRGWGYIYGLDFLCELKERGLTPPGKEESSEKAIAYYLAGLHALEMPRTGGWNYARPQGRDAVGGPSPFMTAPALQALFRAARNGYAVDGAVVDRALGFLEKARAASGSVVYSGEASRRTGRGDATPGAVGRMLATESTLVLAGRGSVQGLRGALDAFLVHWDWLNARRQQTGTHVPPYNVAPYYFMFAHRYAAQAVELLPQTERAEYRRRVNALLFSVRDEDGTWNDRVFRRSSGYGTAMAMLAILQPKMEEPPRWPVPAPGGGTP